MTWKYSEPIKTSVYFLITQRVSSDHFKKKKRWPTQRQNDKQATTGRPKNSPPLTTCPCHQSLPLITRPERNRFLLSWTHLSLWHGCVTSLSQQGLTKKICWRLPEKFSVPSRNDVHQQIDFVFFTGWGHVDYWMCELGLLFFFTFHIQLLHKSFQLYLQNMLRITSFSKSSLTWLLAIFS